MGVYDEYGKDPCVQLKVGPCAMMRYRAGGSVEIPDGLYVGWGGFVLVEGGVLRGTYAEVVTSHGELIAADEIMSGHNPISAAADAIVRELEVEEG